MENVLFKQIVKFVLILVIPLTILGLLFFKGQPEIATAFFIGAILGIFRLKIFWGYISFTLKLEKSGKASMPLIKYLTSVVFTLAAIGLVLFKSPIVGLSMLIGLVAVPAAITAYAAIKGISLYREK